MTEARHKKNIHENLANSTNMHEGKSVLICHISFLDLLFCYRENLRWGVEGGANALLEMLTCTAVTYESFIA